MDVHLSLCRKRITHTKSHPALVEHWSFSREWKQEQWHMMNLIHIKKCWHLAHTDDVRYMCIGTAPKSHHHKFTHKPTTFKTGNCLVHRQTKKKKEGARAVPTSVLEHCVFFFLTFVATQLVCFQ